jgi:hypothetical protein
MACQPTTGAGAGYVCNCGASCLKKGGLWIAVHANSCCEQEDDELYKRIIELGLKVAQPTACCHHLGQANTV